MQKICIAFDLEDFDKYVKKKLGNKDYSYTTTASYVDEVPAIIENENPDILLLSSSLDGSGRSGIGLSFMDMVREVRQKSSCRIIVVAVNMEPGCEFYRDLIGLGIYDIVVGESEVKLSDIISNIYNKKEYRDVISLLGEQNTSDSNVGIKPSVQITIENEAPKKGLFKKNPKKQQDEDKTIEDQKQEGYTNKTKEDQWLDRVPDVEMPKTAPSSDLNTVSNKVEVEQSFKEPEALTENTNPVLSSPVLYYRKPGLIFHLCTQSELQLLHPVSPPVPQPVSSFNVQTPESKQSFQTVESQPVFNEAQDGSVNYYDVPNVPDPEPVLNLYDSFHRESDVLIGDGMPASMMFLKKRQLAKKIVFTGLLDGVGTTSNAINIAFALAYNNPDARILIVNGISNDSTLYDRLNLPSDGYTLDQIAESIISGAIKGNYCLDKKKLMYGANHNEELYAALPDNIEFIRLSMELYENGSMSNLENAIEQLSVAYDYIIFDTKFGYHSSYERMLTKISDIVFFDVIQDFSVLKKTERYLNQTGLRGKAAIIINRYVNSDIDSRYISNNLNITEVFKISNDASGFVNCAAAFQSYFPNGKRKEKKEINQIAERIKTLYG